MIPSEVVEDYIVNNIDRLFLLAGLVLMEYENQIPTTNRVMKQELDRQYVDKVKSVLLTDIACETKVSSDIIVQYVEDVYELFIDLK